MTCIFIRREDTQRIWPGIYGGRDSDDVFTSQGATTIFDNHQELGNGKEEFCAIDFRGSMTVPPP